MPLNRKLPLLSSRTEKKFGVILQYTQMALNVMISFIYTPVMLRILGQAQYGIYNLASSIISYLSLLSLGFGASYIRFYSRYKKANDTQGISKLNGLFMVVFLFMGVVALLSGVVLSRNVELFFNDSYSNEDRATAKILMVILAFNLALSFPNSVFTAYVTSQEKFIFQKLLNAIKTVASPLLTLPILLLGYGSVGMVITTTIITIVADAANLLFCVTVLKMSFDFRNPDFHLLREIAVFSSFIALNQIVDQINWTTDKVILGKVCSSTSVAIYAIGSQLNSYYIQLSTAVSSVFGPQVNQIVASDETEPNKNKKLTQIFTKVGRLQFVVLTLVLSGFIFFGKYFISVWAGSGYGHSYYVALLLMAPATVPLIQNVGIEIQRAKNLHQFRSFIYMGMAILNVAISIVFALIWGEIGAALGTTISILVANVAVMNVFYYKKVGIDIPYFWRKISTILPALIPSSIVGIILNHVGSKSVFSLLIQILLYTMVYLVSFYCFGMDNSERSQIKGIVLERTRSTHS